MNVCSLHLAVNLLYFSWLWYLKSDAKVITDKTQFVVS